MKKDWEKNAEKSIKDYNEEILKILQETGYNDVISLIKGLQKKVKNLERAVEKLRYVSIRARRRERNLLEILTSKEGKYPSLSHWHAESEVG